MGGQPTLGSPSGAFPSSAGGAFPQPAQPATGSSILWQWLAPHVVSLFNQQPGTAAAAPAPTPQATEPEAPAPMSMDQIMQHLQQMGTLAANPATGEPERIFTGDPAMLRHQMRDLDKQLKAGQQPDPAFLQSLIDQGAIWQEEDGGWSGMLPRSGAQSGRLVQAMDSFADYLASKGLPPPRATMPTINYLGQIPPQGAQ